MNGHPMQYLQDDYFKYIGRKINATLTEKELLNNLKENFESWMEKTDSLLISGASKAWIYEHVILAYLRWPFMIHDFTINMVSPMEKTATRYLKSWYKMHRTANPSLLYLPRQNYGLGLTSIETCLKTMQICTTGLVKHSRDPVTKAVFERRSVLEHQSRSSRWKPAVDLELFERALQFQDTFGGQSTRLGLGYNSVSKFRDCPLKMKRKMVAEHQTESETPCSGEKL
jgi:hypothetical protein